MSFWPTVSQFGSSSGQQQSAASAASPYNNDDDADADADAGAGAAAASSAAALHIFSQSSLASSILGASASASAGGDGGAYSQSQLSQQHLSQQHLSQQSQSGLNMGGGKSMYDEGSQHRHHQETCLTCGSTTFLTDDATGLTICATCHTQSQTLSQLETVGEEDVEALAARTGMGRMVSRRVGPKMVLVPDSEIDNSVPFPVLEDCLVGFQEVLRVATDRAASLAGLDDDDGGRQVLMDTVGNIWFGYLRSWREGAEYYAKLHPELRFSLRDAFIGKGRREMVLRHLSAKICSEIRAEDSKRKKKKTKSPGSNGRKRPRGAAADQSQPNKPTFSSIDGMLNHLPPNTDIDNKIAALRVTPSLTLIGSIIHLALTVLRAGVPSNHIVAWAAAGSFPYLTTAYNHLSDELKKTLRPIKTFFVRDCLPPAGQIDYQSDLLALACGMNLRRPKPVNARQNAAACRSDNTQKAAVAARDQVEKGATRYFDNVALLAARLVSDLGFDQRVLDLTLSLIGLRDPPSPAAAAEDGGDEHTDGTEVEWTPLPLKTAAVDRLVSPLHVMAVIAVAVRMCEGWEEWEYHMQDPESLQPQETSRRKGEASVSGQGPHPRFIPTSEAQLQMLGNGVALEGFMDYLEENHFDKDSRLDPFGPFMSSLQNMAKRHAMSTKSEDDRSTAGTAVRPNTAIAGVANPNKRSVDGTDASGVGKYVIYKSSLALRRRKREEIAETRQFHPQYTLLLEYMAYKADAEPSDLHNLVSMLDHEIFSCSCYDVAEVLADKKEAGKKKRKASAIRAQEAKGARPSNVALAMKAREESIMQLYHTQMHQPRHDVRVIQQKSKPKRTRKNKLCSVEGCTKRSRGSRFLHMCQRHHQEKVLGKKN